VRRVPGGVEGWLAGRRGAPTGQLRSTSGDTRSPKPSAGQPSSSTISRQLRTTEQAMAKLTTRRDRLTEQLAGLQDHGELARIGAELTEVQAELDRLEETWLELAEMSSSAS
jgi:hypothetical protein